MATKRQRPSGSWEFIVRRKGVLPRPVSLTFSSEAEGDSYCARLELLLDRGIVPPELIDQKPDIASIADAIRAYLIAVDVSSSDKPVLMTLFEKLGAIQLRSVCYVWAEAWLRDMKQNQQLSPSTIRHYVGTMARCFDWLMRRENTTFVSNPLRLLPKRYAAYTASDAAVLRMAPNNGKHVSVPTDVARDRRLKDGEEAAIRRVLDGYKPAARERALALKWQGALELLFDLALETSMRLRELYTLELDQVDLARRTIFLDKTKNGDKRQVPLSSVAMEIIPRYLEQVRGATRGMAGFSVESRRLFPWWDGRHDAFQLKKTSALLSRQFARIFDAAGCADLRFHDLRHEAASRLFERTHLSDLQIAKITGHKDPRMLSRYANLRGSDLAEQLW